MAEEGVRSGTAAGGVQEVPAGIARANGVESLAVGAALLFFGAYSGRHYFHDDAFISLRYAARLLAGQGLTWTGGPPVEGFTHPLWVLQTALLGALGVDLEAAARWLGVGYMAALVWLWSRARAEPLVLALLLTCPGVLAWAVSGLETVSFAFWCVAAVYSVAVAARAPDDPKAAIIAGLVLAAAALTRPEGLGVAAVGLAGLVVARHVPTLLRATAACALPVAAYAAFRFFYYGDLLPNTAYAKLGGVETVAMFVRAFHQVAGDWSLWVPLALAIGVLCWLRPPRRKPEAWLALAMATPIVASFFLAGGDQMGWLRPLVPVQALVCFAVASPSPASSRRAGLAAMAALGLAVAWNVGVLAIDKGWGTRDLASEIGEPVGRFLEAHLPAGSLVAGSTAGSMPYFAPSLDFIDTLGLNDRHIARRTEIPLRTEWQRVPGHLKGDGAYVLSRQPDVIVLGGAQGFVGRRPELGFLTDYELVHLEGFRAEYEPYRFWVAPAHEPISGYLSGNLKNGRFAFTAYLRTTSERAAGMAASGRRVAAPWGQRSE